MSSTATLVYGVKLTFDAVEQYGVEQYHVKKRKKKEMARLMGQSVKRTRGGGGDSDHDSVGYRDDDEHDDYRGDNHDHTENFWEDTSDTSDCDGEEDSEIDPKAVFTLTRWTFADVEKAFRRQVKGLTLLYCAPFSDCSMTKCVFFAVPLKQPKTLDAMRLEEASEGWRRVIEVFEMGAATKPWFYAALEGE